MDGTRIPLQRRGRILIRTARAALAGALGQEAPPSFPLNRVEQEWLREPGATFVTLRLEEQLRGCIGTLEAMVSLGEDVAHNARAAALEDPRFHPVTAEEYSRLRIEVSLLSRPEPLPHCADIEAAAALLRPGEDGVVLRYLHHRSTFLPQVWESLPAPADFLARLKEKAGLAGEFWSEDIELWCYTVDKWSEY